VLDPIDEVQRLLVLGVLVESIDRLLDAKVREQLARVTSVFTEDEMRGIERVDRARRKIGEISDRSSDDEQFATRHGWQRTSVLCARHIHAMADRMNATPGRMNAIFDRMNLAWRTVNAIFDRMNLAWRTVNAIFGRMNLAVRTVNAMADRMNPASRTVNAIRDRINVTS